MEQSSYDRQLPGYDDLRRTHMAEAPYATFNNNGNSKFEIQRFLTPLLIAVVGWLTVDKLTDIKTSIYKIENKVELLSTASTMLQTKVENIEAKQAMAQPRGERIDRNVQELVETRKGR